MTNPWKPSSSLSKPLRSLLFWQPYELLTCVYEHITEPTPARTASAKGLLWSGQPGTNPIHPLNAVLDLPEVQLVHSLVINVGGERLADVDATASLFAYLTEMLCWMPLGISKWTWKPQQAWTRHLDWPKRSTDRLTLLVADEMLGSSNDTSVLDTLDCLNHTISGKDWVSSERLPSSSTYDVGLAVRKKTSLYVVISQCIEQRLTSSHTAKSSSNGTKQDVDALVLGFLAHSLSTAVHQPLIERGAGGDASRKDRDPIGETDTGGRVLQTEASETQAGDGTNVANAEIACPATNTSTKKCQYSLRFVWGEGVAGCHSGGHDEKKGGLLTYPTPVVKLTFSSRVICETKSFALT